MAKYIIIEEDPKIRREMRGYLRELDAEAVILDFNNSKDFDQNFLLPLIRPKSETKPGYNALQGLNPEIIKYLNNANFASEPPFPGDVLTLEVARDTFAIEKTNLTSGKVFGEDFSVAFQDKPSLEKFVLIEFKDAFQNFKKRVMDGGEDLRQVIAIESPNHEIWVLELEAAPTKKNIILNARNLRSEVLKLLGKEDHSPKPETVEALDMCIFRLSAILEKDIGAWVTRVAALTKKMNLWPANSRPKFIATRFEDEKRDKVEFSHPFVDDMICLPFDRLIFLQKAEIILKLPEMTEPSYLFVQETHDPIEVGKHVTIERVSDLGIAVANPVPLAAGTPAHFYFKFPGQKMLLDCYAKVTHSLAHPERENEYLVYFAFFGLHRDVLKELRAYLARDTGHKMVLNNNAAEFEYNPDNIFLTDEQKRRKTVAIIDLDERNLENVSTILRRDMGGLNVVTETSYYNFIRTYLTSGSVNEKAPPAPKEDFYDVSVSLLVDINDSSLQMQLTPPAPEQKLLGHDAVKLFSGPTQWLDLFNNNHARNLLTECFYLVQSVKRLQRSFELDHADGSLKSVTVEIILEDNGQHARLTLSPVDPRAVAVRRVDPLDSLEAVVIDLGSIPGEMDSFIHSLREAVVQAGVKTYPDGPKVILMGGEKLNMDVLMKALKNPAVTAFVQKSIEVRRLCYLMHCALDNPFTLYCFENIGWKNDVIYGKITREGELVELAEFGATLKLKQKLKTGSMIYLFKSIYASAPDANICCRVYHSEPAKDDSGDYLNYVTYYGITDAFLKFTRSYIRETYAEKKAQESGGAEE